MKIKSIHFKDKKDDEEMLVIYILDDNDEEIEHLTFYNKNEFTKIQPELRSSIQRLPELIESIYNSGNQDIDFEVIEA